ncbi:MAG: FAD-binding protein [Hyphomicrobiaceae bacterium]
MIPKTSKRVFLKRASSLAALAGLSPSLSLPALAQPVDAELDALATELATEALGQIVRLGQPEHAKIKYYNARFDCVRTKAFVRPKTIEGVQKTLAWARQHRRNLAIRGAGHSFEGRSSHPDLVIDMSLLKGLTFDDDGTLKVEAGVLLGDVYTKIAAAGHVFPGGTCPTVGIVGHTLGGGIGDFLPMFGYAAQHLTEVTLVTLSGSILKVNDERIELLGGTPLPEGDLKARDLMTVLRGGGQGSLGVVTNMTLKTQDVRTAKLASFKLEDASGVSARRMVAIIQAWQAWREALSKPMQSMISAKLNLSRSGNGYDFDIAGLVVIPQGSDVDIAAVRQALNVLFQIPELKKKSFAPLSNAAAAIKTFLDDNETTTNSRRRMLYGSSSALPQALPPRATQHLIQAMPTNLFVSLYTAGGVANGGVATSLHPSEFLIEWAIYSLRVDTGAHRRIRTINAQVMRLAGFKDHALPSYPDNDARDYFANRPKLEATRRLFDPDSLSTSSLLVKAAMPPGPAGCG